jgi:glutathione peroxidase
MWARGDTPATQPTTQPASVHDFTVENNDGQSVDLASYKGKVLLIVNTASKCGLTPQYEGLEKLYQEHKADGLAILAFPANEFGGQEPGTNAEIREFCSTKYSVTFDLFAKMVVKGDEISPLYQFLTSPQTDPQFPGEIQWNFTKFLISRDGQIVARFEPAIKPDDEALVMAVEAELGK